MTNARVGTFEEETFALLDRLRCFATSLFLSLSLLTSSFRKKRILNQNLRSNQRDVMHRRKEGSEIRAKIYM